MSQRRGARGRPGGGGGGAGGSGGNAGARGALLLAVAVILGIVLLQQFDTDVDSGAQVSTDTSAVSGDETTTTRRVGLTTAPPVVPTTAAARPKGEVKVLVANGSGLRGLAAATSNSLKGLGYATLSPVDATATVEKTSVQFADGWEAEAREVAASLSLPATVVTRATSPPVAPVDLGDAKVVVVLGTDVPGSSTTAPAGGTTTTTRRP